MASRRLTDLARPVYERAERFILACEAEGIDLLVTCTYRSLEEQAELYAQGRDKPGRKVTNAKAGESLHNYRLAFDVVPLVGGKCVWNASDTLWVRVGALGMREGLEWAGQWPKDKREFPHFQYTGGLTLKQIQAGMMPT